MVLILAQFQKFQHICFILFATSTYICLHTKTNDRYKKYWGVKVKTLQSIGTIHIFLEI